MSDINRQREAVAKAYDHSPGWANRVKNMPDSQVVAIYIRLKSEGKL